MNRRPPSPRHRSAIGEAHSKVVPRARRHLLHWNVHVRVVEVEQAVNRRCHQEASPGIVEFADIGDRVKRRRERNQAPAPSSDRSPSRATDHSDHAAARDRTARRLRRRLAHEREQRPGFARVSVSEKNILSSQGRSAAHEPTRRAVEPEQETPARAEMRIVCVIAVFHAFAALADGAAPVARGGTGAGCRLFGGTGTPPRRRRAAFGLEAN
jgi:hypothetical protein